MFAEIFVFAKKIFFSTFKILLNNYVCTYVVVFMYMHACIIGAPKLVPNITAVYSIIDGDVTLTLSWGEPFNNLNPIVNYTVSCSGDVTCPPNFTTTDNTTRSHTITNLALMTNYIFSVVATNSIGSGEAGVVTITSPGRVTGIIIHKLSNCA